MSDKKKIYMVCSVRGVSEEEAEKVAKYVELLESAGHSVHYPPRDVNQKCDTGVSIVDAHRKAMMECDQVHIMWNVESSGSHFDLGMAVALDKKIVGVDTVHEDGEGKSYWKVIKEYESRNKNRGISIVDTPLKTVIENIEVGQ